MNAVRQFDAPLAGLVVVETGPEAAVRYCGRLFAALGATVHKVDAENEFATTVDIWLDEGKRPAPDWEAALDCLLAAPRGLRVVLAGQSPDTVDRVDAALTAWNVDVLRVGVTWFGHDGPYRDWIGDDALIQALVGIADGFGEIDGRPVLPQGFAPQIATGATTFVGALAALWGRRRGSAGPRRLDVNVLEAAMCFTEVASPIHEARQVPVRRTGVNRFPGNHPTTVYATGDGWLGVTALTPAQWAGMADLIGRQEWATDERFATSAQRVAHADTLDAELSRILATRSTEHWLIEGQKRRVPLAPVPSHAELLATRHWLERDAFVQLTGAPTIRAPKLPFIMSVDHEPTAPDETPAPLLEGVRVADFSMGWAGPLATRLLADLGADVVKIESEDHFDWWRGWEPVNESDPPAFEVVPPFNVMNRNKRGICLDLATSAGRTQAKALVARADIVIENYAPGVMAKLQLSREVLASVRPGLVMVSMGAFGATGPWSFFRAYGSTVEHASGMPHTNGKAAWPPALQHAAYGDPVAGLYAAAAALVGLYGRARLGGAWFDLAQVECLFELGADAIITAQTEGPPARLGSRHPKFFLRCVVPCADGYLAVVCRTEAEWATLCACLDRPDLNTAVAFAGRSSDADADGAESALTDWAAELSGEVAAKELQTRGIPAAPVVAGHRLPFNAHLAKTGAWMRIDRRYVGNHLMAAPVFIADGLRLKVHAPAPTLGQHDADILPHLVDIPSRSAWKH